MPTLADISEEPEELDYPRTRKKVPFLVIFENGYGELVGKTRPQETHIIQEKKTEGASWELKRIPAEIERYWMTPADVRHADAKTHDMLESNFLETAKNDPEKALKAIKQGAKNYEPDTPNTVHRDCAVCSEPVHMVRDSYNEVDNRVVCESHTAGELADNNLI